MPAWLFLLTLAVGSSQAESRADDLLSVIALVHFHRSRHMDCMEAPSLCVRLASASGGLRPPAESRRTQFSRESLPFYSSKRDTTKAPLSSAP